MFKGLVLYITIPILMICLLGNNSFALDLDKTDAKLLRVCEGNLIGVELLVGGTRHGHDRYNLEELFGVYSRIKKIIDAVGIPIIKPPDDLLAMDYYGLTDNILEVSMENLSNWWIEVYTYEDSALSYYWEGQLDSLVMPYTAARSIQKSLGIANLQSLVDVYKALLNLKNEVEK